MKKAPKRQAHTIFDKGLEAFKKVRANGTCAYLIDMRSNKNRNEAPIWDLDPQILRDDVLHFSLTELNQRPDDTLKFLQGIARQYRPDAVITILTPLFIFCDSGYKSEQAEKLLKLKGHLNVRSIGGMNLWSDHSQILRKLMKDYCMDANDIAFMISRIPPKKIMPVDRIRAYLSGRAPIPEDVMKKISEMTSHICCYTLFSFTQY